MDTRTLKKRKQDFLEALKASMGNVTVACDRAKVGRTSVYEWKKKDDKFAQAIDEATERQKDFVENKLMNKINEGDTTAIIFYLKTRCKDRGYSDRLEITGKEGRDLMATKSDAELEQEIQTLKRKLGSV